MPGHSLTLCVTTLTVTTLSQAPSLTCSSQYLLHLELLFQKVQFSLLVQGCFPIKPSLCRHYTKRNRMADAINLGRFKMYTSQVRE